MLWSRLPSEIWETILQNLDLDTIKSLRLMNQCAAERCLGPRFLSYASHVETDLTEESLMALLTRALHPSFRNAVRHLTISAISYDQSGKEVLYYNKEDSYEGRDCGIIFVSEDPPTMIPLQRWPISQHDLAWTKKQQRTRDALSNEFIIETLVCALNEFSSLDEIKLQSWIMTSPDRRWSPYEIFWPLTFPWASHVCYLVLAAMVKSTTTVRALDIFRDLNRESIPYKRCSIPAKDFATHFAKISKISKNSDDKKDMRLLLERLALSISTGMGTKSRIYRSMLERTASLLTPSFLKSEDDEALGVGDLSGVTRLLKCAADNLQDLDLHFDHDSLDVPQTYYHLFTSIADQTHFHQLQKCRLVDLPVTVPALLRFLEKHQNMSYLTMEGLMLSHREEWHLVFKFISTNMRNLDVLCLSHLHQGGIRINMDQHVFAERYYPPGHESHGRFFAVSSVNCAPPDLYFLFAPRCFD
ncbi:hypothetical protein NUU61_003989 [Penicillium alfredii]|uniref:F-box domain-containing protein n=1 Tax=Penicillium alfredii TaxID=1506179 RepID=A0A9W9FKT4_9EURO|nr:uncharacterized protein NUU61_003989 [Penicillium alfredii]KAJ5101767.1 hypothetical protein NUU61_003989 [Penicillium alfredii]